MDSGFCGNLKDESLPQWLSIFFWFGRIENPSNKAGIYEKCCSCSIAELVYVFIDARNFDLANGDQLPFPFDLCFKLLWFEHQGGSWQHCCLLCSDMWWGNRILVILIINCVFSQQWGSYIADRPVDILNNPPENIDKHWLWNLLLGCGKESKSCRR